MATITENTLSLWSTQEVPTAWSEMQRYTLPIKIYQFVSTELRKHEALSNCND